MHHSNWAESALDYNVCRYGSSRMLYRGPKKRLNNNYIAFLGGSETYGKFVATPYPQLLEDQVGIDCVNLGCLNAGIDAILQDESLLSICNRAELTVIQVMGASDISNRFYTVHPRRNDRFIQASPLMERMFPNLDFVEFNFTRHLLVHAKQRHPEQFQLLVKNLQETWIVRMRQLIQRLQGNVLLLWVGEGNSSTKPLKSEPYLVTRRMLDSVRIKAKGYVEVIYSQDVKSLGTEGMHFLDHEFEAAKRLPGPVAHRAIADALGPALRNMA